MFNKSEAYMVIGIFVLLLGLGFIFMGLLSMGDSVSEYDDWVSDPAREPGDSIKVTGKIDEGNELFGGLWGYVYTFKGSDVPFYSGEEIGGEGDTITVEITISDEGLPVASGKSSLEVCWFPGVLSIVIGIILITVGFIFRGKQPETQVPGYAQYYPQPYQPQQQYQQYTPQQPDYQPPASPPDQYYDESYDWRYKKDRR